MDASPAPGAPKYRGFRFDMAHAGVDVLDKYEQVWCFGFKPGNSGSSNDADIDQPIALPASNAELAKLAKWMNERKGGLFGTGDHHFLGASMCRRIPAWAPCGAGRTREACRRSERLRESIRCGHPRPPSSQERPAARTTCRTRHIKAT